MIKDIFTDKLIIALYHNTIITSIDYNLSKDRTISTYSTLISQ